MKVLKSILFLGAFALVCMSFAMKSNDVKKVDNVGEMIQSSFEEKASEKTFAEFLSQFEKVELPYEYGIANVKINIALKGGAKSKLIVQKEENDHTLSLDNMNFIPEMKHAAFGRMGPPVFEAIARFYPNEKTVAVIYSGHNRFGRGMNKNVQLVCYDLNGNVLNEGSKDYYANSRLAYSSIDKTGTFRIDESGYIWKNTYKNEWEKDIKEVGVRGNEVDDYVLANTEVFKINESGEVEKLTEYPVASN